MLLLNSVRGFRTNRSLIWLACVPVALAGLGIFNLSAHAADLPALNAAFLANKATCLVASVSNPHARCGHAGWSQDNQCHCLHPLKSPV